MKRDNGFDKNPERARIAGMKSKRKSWKTIREKAEDAIKKKLGVEDPDVLAVMSLVELMQEKDTKAIEIWLDREFGKSKQTTELTGADGGAIQTVSIDPKKYAEVRKKMLKEDDV